jgi:hypothetical protein
LNKGLSIDEDGYMNVESENIGWGCEANERYGGHNDA